MAHLSWSYCCLTHWSRNYCCWPEASDGPLVMELLLLDSLASAHLRFLEERCCSCCNVHLSVRWQFIGALID
jgi:hypothetical protein